MYILNFEKFLNSMVMPYPLMPGSRPTRPNPIFAVDSVFEAVPKAVPNPSHEPSHSFSGSLELLTV